MIEWFWSIPLVAQIALEIVVASVGLVLWIVAFMSLMAVSEWICTGLGIGPEGMKEAWWNR